MSTYVYAPILFEGSKDLIEALGAKWLRKHNGMHFIHKGRPMQFDNGDLIVCWGAHIPKISGVKIVNASAKFHNQIILNEQAEQLLSFDNIKAVNLMKFDSDAAYLTALSRIAKYGILRYTDNYSTLIPTKTFFGYGTRYYGSCESESKIYCFEDTILACDNYIEGNLEIAKAALKCLRLDFAKITINSNGIIRKIVTSPCLTSELARNLATVIKTLTNSNAH